MRHRRSQRYEKNVPQGLKASDHGASDRCNLQREFGATQRVESYRVFLQVLIDRTRRAVHLITQAKLKCPKALFKSRPGQVGQATLKTIGNVRPHGMGARAL